MASATSELTCALKSCCDKSNLQNQSRVEVKSFASPIDDHFLVEWKSDGQAVFHRDCWAPIKSLKGVKYGKEIDMVKEAAKTAEYFDSPGAIDKEARKIADMLKNACHAIAFTGAGISTSAGIGDFRGKGGAWTERDRKKNFGAAAKTANNRKTFTYESLRPTYTHEAIAKLISMGMLNFVISQNVDGIHRLSGIPAAQISELHGNVFHEKCEKCKTRYERPFACRGLHKKAEKSKVPEKKCPTCRINHRTGGICDKKGCGGYLMNTIINFGDSLEGPVIQNAEDNATANDMVLCLGSSLRVTPACDFVEMGNPVKLVICNRQPTPFDKISHENGSRVHGDCDDMMRLVMKYVLGEVDLKEWEEGRDHRLDDYATQRS